MYDNNVCQLYVCDMGADGRSLNMEGVGGQGRAMSFDVTSNRFGL